MRPYWAIFSARFRLLLQYRAAALAGLGTQIFFGVVRMMIFAALYRVTLKPQPMSHAEVVTYIWLGQALFLLTLFHLDGDVVAMIRSGTLAYEMLRPLDLYSLWFCRAVAIRTGPVLLRAVPMFVIAGLFLGLQAPASVTCGLLWVVATFGALMLSSAIGTLMTISMLWTLSGEGIARILPTAAFVFSGLIVPLPLWPDWLQPLLNALPFRGIADVPFRIYMGHIAPQDAWAPLLQQAIWAAGLMFFGRWVLSRGLRRVVVQGG